MTSTLHNCRKPLVLLGVGASLVLPGGAFAHAAHHSHVRHGPSDSKPTTSNPGKPIPAAAGIKPTTVSPGRPMMPAS